MLKVPFDTKRMACPNKILLQLPMDFQPNGQVSENQIILVINVCFTIQRRNTFVTRLIDYDVFVKAFTLKKRIRLR